MAFNRSHARSLCTDAEYKLFTASLADEITTLTPAQLRGKIQRARRLRDKYRDLFKRQRLANRARTGSKKGERTDTNARTAAKAKLFEEALRRFSARDAELTAAAERKARRAAARQASAARIEAKQKAGAKRAAALARGKGKGAGRKQPGAAGYTSRSAQVSAIRKLGRDNRAAARRGQATAAGKRSQARRDRRR